MGPTVKSVAILIAVLTLRADCQTTTSGPREIVGTVYDKTANSPNLDTIFSPANGLGFPQPAPVPAPAPVPPPFDPQALMRGFGTGFGEGLAGLGGGLTGFGGGGMPGFGLMLMGDENGLGESEEEMLGPILLSTLLSGGATRQTTGGPTGGMDWNLLGQLQALSLLVGET